LVNEAGISALASSPLVMFVLVEVTEVQVDELCSLYSKVASSWSSSLSETTACIVVPPVDNLPTHGYGEFRQSTPDAPLV
jgi:hypothetical protein